MINKEREIRDKIENVRQGMKDKKTKNLGG